jgi:hypothetical protein
MRPVGHAADKTVLERIDVAIFDMTVIRHTPTLTGNGAIRFAIAPYDCANTAPAHIGSWHFTAISGTQASLPQF